MQRQLSDISKEPALLLLGDSNFFYENTRTFCFGYFSQQRSVANYITTEIESLDAHREVYKFPLYSLRLRHDNRVKLESLMKAIGKAHNAVDVVLWTGQGDAWEHASNIGKTMAEVESALVDDAIKFCKYLNASAVRSVFLVGYVDHPDFAALDRYVKAMATVQRAMLSALERPREIAPPPVEAYMYVDSTHFTPEGQHAAATHILRAIG